MDLQRGRAHEACGSGARAFAAMVCGVASGPVLWIVEARERQLFHARGLATFFDPDRLILARPEALRDVLWTMEEALRSAAAAVVVAELSKPADLTASRRLQLAAEVGGGLGLFLVPEGGGTNAAETRWHCVPAAPAQECPAGPDVAAESTFQHWRLIKNKRGTLGQWIVEWHGAAHRIRVVSETGDGPSAAQDHAAYGDRRVA